MIHRTGTSAAPFRLVRAVLGQALGLALGLSLAAAAPSASAAGPLEAGVDAQVSRNHASVEGLYKALHAAPELAFQETQTAQRLAAELRALGFEVTEGVGKTGVVGLLRNGSGPTIMVRTELDALLMEEKPGGKPLPINHSPFFAPVPEPSLKTAVKAMSLAVLTALGR